MVAVATANGPHVTPELFAVADGRIWCATAANTLKAKLLADPGPVALLARVDYGHAVAIGEAVTFDIRHPLRNLSHFAPGLAASSGVRRFAVRNAAELTGGVIDFFTGRLGAPLPPRRVLLCMEPRATAVLAADGSLLEARGWEDRAEPLPTRPGAPAENVDLLDEVPEGLRNLAASGAADIGWSNVGGDPVVLPGHWDAGRARVTVPSAIFAVAGSAATSRIAITRDIWTGFGPSGKQGLMIRGHGVATSDGDAAAIDVEIDAVTYWDGVETGTARFMSDANTDLDRSVRPRCRRHATTR